MAGSEPLEPLVTTDWLEDHLGDPDLRVVDIRGYVTTRPVAPGVEEAIYRGARGVPRRAHPGGGLHRLDARHRRPRRPGPRADRAAGSVRRGDGRARDRRRDARHRRRPHGRPVRHPALVGLRYYGHDRVSVLDGGWNRWVEEGRPVEAGRGRVRPAPSSTPAPGPSCGRRPSRSSPGSASPALQLLDARDAGQFTGVEPPRAARRPHPGRAERASRAVLRRRRAASCRSTRSGRRVEALGLRPDRPTIAYCNGGVAATVVLFNLSRLGFLALDQLRRLVERVGRSSRPAGRIVKDPVMILETLGTIVAKLAVRGECARLASGILRKQAWVPPCERGV